MRNLIIIGAGGMGRTIYDMALENNGYLKDFQIKGFIDDDIHQLDRFGNYPPIISTILEYEPDKMIYLFVLLVENHDASVWNND